MFSELQSLPVWDNPEAETVIDYLCICLKIVTSLTGAATKHQKKGKSCGKRPWFTLIYHKQCKDINLNHTSLFRKNSISKLMAIDYYISLLNSYILFNVLSNSCSCSSDNSDSWHILRTFLLTFKKNFKKNCIKTVNIWYQFRQL